MDQNRRTAEKMLMIAAFAFFVLITCYKLTNAALWLDETIEFWFSKIMIGVLPYETAWADAPANMYQRIITTYQPPLYNFLMYFWLKFGTSVGWFRFFGVIMGFLANAAIYKTIKKISNGFIAAGAVFFTSCIYRLVYYWQECAEYCLMLAVLCWTLYSFICLLEEQSLKNIILYTVLSTLSVYSQYGAVFPVLALSVIAYLFILHKKNNEAIRNITVSYLAALLFAAVPLVWFFMIKQMHKQHGGEIQTASFTVDGNIFTDMFKNLKTVINWNLFSYFDARTTVVFTLVFMISGLLVLMLSKKTHTRMLAAANIITWILYYFTVKFGLYSYGSFGSRYNLFFLPLWVISIFCFGYELYVLFRANAPEKLMNFSYLYIGTCITLLVCFMASSWTLKLQQNWSKEDMRGAVDAWLKAGAQDSDTIVYYGSSSGFAYYLRQKDNYSPEMEKNVHYMHWLYEKTFEEFAEFVNSTYGNEWPKEIYIAATHIQKDLDILISIFTDEGYERKDLYTSNGLLLRLTENGSK